MTETSASRNVRVVAGGPIIIDGPVTIQLPDGRVVQSDRFKVAICACRRAKTYPLCDTSHRRPTARKSAQRSQE